MTTVKPKIEEGMVFDLECSIVPVMIGEKEYELRELSAAAACKYQNDIASRAQVGKDGSVVAVKDIADTEPLLLHLSIYDVETQKRVPLEEIRQWPNKIMKELCKRAKEISGLETEKGKEEGKSDSSDTTDG